MPEKVERCVTGLLAKWKADPSKRPEPREKGQSEKDQAWAICQASVKAEDMIDLISLEGIGPTILGGAITNRPYIHNLPPIEIIQEAGEEKLLIPFIAEGKYSHPKGTLVFSPAVFNKMIENYKSGVLGRDISVDHRHKPEFGAVAWFEDVFVKDSILYAKAAPTPTGLEAIKNKNFRYASIEFHRDWSTPKLEFSSEDLTDFVEEEDMPETVSLELYQEEVQKREALEARFDTLETAQDAQIAKLEEAHRATVARLEAQTVDQAVNAIVLEAEAYRDDLGQGHHPALISWAGTVLRFEDIGEGEAVIHLEEDTAPKHRSYIRRAIAFLLKELPGSVPLESSATEREKARSIELDAESGDKPYTEAETAEHQGFWEL